MHKLIGSLLLVVLIAIVGLGWGLDQLFFGLTKGDPDPLAAYRTVGSELATNLDGRTDIEEFVANWTATSEANYGSENEVSLTDNSSAGNSDSALSDTAFAEQPLSSGVRLSLLAVDDLLLPEDVRVGFIEGESVALESETGVELFFYLPQSNRILAMRAAGIRMVSQLNDARLLLTIAFCAGILALISLWLYPLVKRLLNLRKVARDFGNGSLDRRIKLSRRSYISDIEVEFNRMAQRIETLVDDNKLLGNAVSHELRTPLSSLRLGFDALDEIDDPPLREKFMKRLKDDLEQMEKLVEVSLDFAKLERCFDDMERKPVNLGQVVSSAVAAAGPHDKTIEWDGTGQDHELYGNEQYLPMLFSNLLKNALRHASRVVSISTQKTGNQIELLVEDDGPGIPESEREALMKPFVRSSVASRGDGYGLGLAIVGRIALAHGGHFSIDHSSALGGALMRVQLPIGAEA